MKVFFKYQVLTAFVALLLAYVVVSLLLKSSAFTSENTRIKVIKGSKASQQGFMANLVAADSCEVEFLGSLAEKNGITLLGSSEITGDFKYMPHRFLPQQFGFRVNSFGHAYQQCFAIYMQLLANKDALKGSKICIILSPGWFEQGGTNIEAFLEFARPNFLKKIIKDQSISKKDKEYIGAFIEGNYEHIENPSKELNYFYNLYKFKNVDLLNAFYFSKHKEIEDVSYQVKTIKSKMIAPVVFNWDSLTSLERTKFIRSVKSNKKFISDSYFGDFIKQKDGSAPTTEFLERDVTDNQELKDFKMLVDLLKDNGADATFVLQQLNPFHYENLESFNPFVNEIQRKLNSTGFPFLNKFQSNPAKFEPAVLNDIMHFGEVAWLQIDEFLINNYAND